jgi:hypothetical protein
MGPATLISPDRKQVQETVPVDPQVLEPAGWFRHRRSTSQTSRWGCLAPRLTWRKIPEVDRNELTRDKALAVMIESPTLIKRPVLEDDNFIAVGFSEKRFSEFLRNL